ncbi:DUF3105 domain-containing protein [uncultured Nocardioides sp.]|uniref:DUF3105 domain-containing protein n=1 Tax=uncultured Nocardioides sp. TaxID=198441 RepID=UPI000C55E6FE|nr:DUF3105 domain-containing protein [uncultured Nocardioides sp.]MAO79391.1 hypothetical protein [Nocardioides sp.]
MAKTVKSERQAKLDKIRKQQRGAESRRSFAIIGTCALIAVAIVAAAAYQPIKGWWDQRGFSDTDLAAIGAPASVCGEITTKSAEGSGNHVDDGQQVFYDDAPPAFGPHWNVFGKAPVPIGREFYTESDRPELEQLMHNLEHGFTIMWYDETVADDADQLTELRAIARKFSDTTDRRNAFIIAPWTETDGADFPDGKHVALTHWSAGGVGVAEGEQVGVWQYCDSPSGEAVDSFVREYPQQDSPEPDVAM